MNDDPKIDDAYYNGLVDGWAGAESAILARIGDIAARIEPSASAEEFEQAKSLLQQLTLMLEISAEFHVAKTVASRRKKKA